MLPTLVRLAGVMGIGIVAASGDHNPTTLALLAMLVVGGQCSASLMEPRKSAGETIRSLPDLRVVHRDKRLEDEWR